MYAYIGVCLYWCMLIMVYAYNGTEMTLYIIQTEMLVIISLLIVIVSYTVNVTEPIS